MGGLLEPEYETSLGNRGRQRNNERKRKERKKVRRTPSCGSVSVSIKRAKKKRCLSNPYYRVLENKVQGRKSDRYGIHL